MTRKDKRQNSNSNFEPKIEKLFKGYDAVSLIASDEDQEVIPSEVGLKNKKSRI